MISVSLLVYILLYVIHCLDQLSVFLYVKVMSMLHCVVFMFRPFECDVVYILLFYFSSLFVYMNRWRNCIVSESVFYKC